MKATEVGAVMTTDVVTAAYGTPLKDVVRRLADHRVGGLPVTDDEDRVVGVICASDLTRRRVREAVPAVTVRARATVTEASCLMTTHGVERLPVVDNEERLVGIVTRRDLFRAVLRTDGDIDRAVRRYVLGTALWLTPRALAVGVEDGVVTLTGQVERRSDIELAVDAASRIDGVVAVVDQLSYRVDDTRLPTGTAAAHGETGEPVPGR